MLGSCTVVFCTSWARPLSPNENTRTRRSGRRPASGIWNGSRRMPRPSRRHLRPRTLLEKAKVPIPARAEAREIARRARRSQPSPTARPPEKGKGKELGGRQPRVYFIYEKCSNRPPCPDNAVSAVRRGSVSPDFTPHALEHALKFGHATPQVHQVAHREIKEAGG